MVLVQFQEIELNQIELSCIELNQIDISILRVCCRVEQSADSMGAAQIKI